MNPTLRGLLIVAFVAALIVVLQLEQALVALSILLQVAFLLAVAVFLYLAWRERRGEIGTWPGRAQGTFYGAAVVIVADVAAYWLDRPTGVAAAAFVAVLVLCALAMVRVWRDQQRYV